MCCHVVQTRVDCLQMEDVFESLDTNSEAGLVSSPDEFNVEQDAKMHRRKRAKIHKIERVLNVTMS